ncbi:phenylalanyl-tRNA synthetase beta chain [Culex quinquefasciatus]|uniref:Phenylalanyl-tRNA synthetase beta chain n=1 Tax=Culex quinquefasciatus TaxID=7176 RepID=B0WCE6_CULQU|nr:phenylalanyl-tRNA synthetase beta chain [Culex quinquefasciatus]|eukprot:XP_001846380.1 phenylalanyl-tRNA synthetase beta chain [Culex quinquefasciatus]
MMGRKLCFEFALELDEVTTEKQMIRTGGCGQGCENGLVQGLQMKEFPEFKKVASAKGPPQKLIVTEATKQFWPFAETILTAKANVYIGIDESAEALTKMLNRLFPTTQKASNQLEVLIPPTRHDMLHVCDIEDVGAYGYNRIPKTLPATIHIARQCPLNKLTKQLLSDVVLADSEVGAKNERRVCAVKLLDRVFCYWDALGQAGLLPARPRVKMISAYLPTQFNCPQKYAMLKSFDRSSPTENDSERCSISKQLLPISALREPRFEELYQDRFPSARRRLRNLQFCACYSRIRVVHLVSRNALAEQIFMDWHQKFGQNSGCKVVKLTEETGTNIKLIA